MRNSNTLITRFNRDDKGSITIMFTLGLMLIIICVGAALDTGRAMQVASRTATALDAAALAAAKAMREEGLDESEVIAVAQDYFESNSKDSAQMNATYNQLQVNTDPDAGRVTLAVTGTMPTIFTRLAGLNQFNINRSSTAIYNIRDIELGMMLDVTGSMGGQKIEDLREAAKKLVDILITNNETNQNVRIGLAPYSASVNAGAYSNLVTDPVNPSTDGCVIERTGGSAYSDIAPGNGTWVSAANPGSPPADVDPTEGNGSYRCPSVSVMPLTNDHDALKARIDSFSAGGWTSGHIGLAWAWYLISPDWNNIWPAESTPVAYKDGKTIKAVILMTDGNFNTAYANGQSGNQAEELCDAMRDSDKEIVVFSVAFQAPPAAEDLLRNCASAPSGTIETTYFNAENGNELELAFATIAIQLNNLRLAQ